jgi:hypothetical protein
MNNTEDDIHALRARITAAQHTRVRAEHDRDIAQMQAQQATAALAAEFGVSTVDDARARLDELRTELAHEIQALQADLDAMGV